MRRKTTKLNKKEIIEKAKSSKPDRENYTFRLPNDLMSEFKAVCKKAEVKQTQVLEELLKAFLEDK